MSLPLAQSPNRWISHAVAQTLELLLLNQKQRVYNLTLKAPNTIIAEFANTADPNEIAHIEQSCLDLQGLPSSL